MICRHLIQILCWTLIVDCTVKNVRAISFEDFFEYILDAVDYSDESPEELGNSNLNVTCKNCNLTVQCTNCTQSPKDTQSTISMLTSTQTNNKQSTPTSLSTPTIPAPDRGPETVPTQKIPSQGAATTPQNVPTKTVAANNPEAPTTQIASTKSAVDQNQMTDVADPTTDADSGFSDPSNDPIESTTQ